jgi:hypothetical protein
LSIVLIAIGTVLGLIPIYLPNRSNSLSSTEQIQASTKSLTLSETVSLQTNSVTGRKKKQILNSQCSQYQSSLSVICTGLTNLNNCNGGLTSYLKDFTNTSVRLKKTKIFEYFK